MTQKLCAGARIICSVLVWSTTSAQRASILIRMRQAAPCVRQANTPRFLGALPARTVRRVSSGPKEHAFRAHQTKWPTSVAWLLVFCAQKAPRAPEVRMSPLFLDIGAPAQNHTNFTSAHTRGLASEATVLRCVPLNVRLREPREFTFDRRLTKPRAHRSWAAMRGVHRWSLPCTAHQRMCGLPETRTRLPHRGRIARFVCFALLDYTAVHESTT